MMANDALHVAGPDLDSSKRTRRGTLNVQTHVTTLIPTLDLAVQADLVVLALQECWVSVRAKKGIRKATRARCFRTWFGPPRNGRICTITFYGDELLPLSAVTRDDESQSRVQLFAGAAR